MGYHNEHNLNVQIDKLDALELDMRRRLFYCTYKMDRLLSQALGRPVSIPDGFINVPVSPPSLSQMWCNLAYMVRFQLIVSCPPH